MRFSRLLQARFGREISLERGLGASYHTEILQKHILGFIVGGEDLTADTTLRGSKITKIEK